MIITIINQKGGTGKTTTTINLGKALRLRKKKVLLIDLDPQGNLSYSLNIPEEEKGIAEIIAQNMKIKELIIKREGMDVIASNLSLADIELTLQGLKDRAFILKNILNDVKDLYDYILIDCPPSLSLLTINALTATNKVIVPILLDVLSLQGLKQIMRTINKIKIAFNQQLELLGVLAVNVDDRKRLSREIMQFMDNNYNVYVFNNYIRTNVKASEAPSFGMSVIEYAPNSNSAKDYRNLANEILMINKN